MGNILGRYILPHPPAAVAEIGKENTAALAKTIEAFHQTAKEIAALKPETIVILSPHSPCFGDHFYMPSQKRISGDFSAFGAKKPILGFDNNITLAEQIHQKAGEKQLSAGFIDDRVMKQKGIPYDLDHGVLVPLYFICQHADHFRLLPISLSGLGGRDHYRFGMVLRDALREYPENTVIIASGDLSHKISDNSPYGFCEEGPIFDKTIRRLLLEENAEGFLTFDPNLKEKAAQCGLDAFRVLLGTADGFDFITNIRSYEAPFGIGYLSAAITCGKACESVFTRFEAEREIRLEKRWELESEPAQLARKAVAAYLKNGEEIPVPEETPLFLQENQGGVFISLYNDGRLRGCIGTTAATHPNLAMEIIYNAVCAATKDPRFTPVTKEELKEITITVSVLSEMETITDHSELDPAKYGILVENRGKRGVLLPGTPGIDSVEEQIRAARDKAGIHPWHKLKIKRFTVTEYQ